MADAEDSIIWDEVEYPLRHVLDNCKLPQTVRVVEGFYFSDDDSLSCGTVLEMHGVRTITKLNGYSWRRGKSREISIPINCPCKLQLVSVNDKSQVTLPTVNDLSNSNVKYVRANKSLLYSGTEINPGQMLMVEGTKCTQHGRAKGVKVSLLHEQRAVLLPLHAVGDFTPCLPPDCKEKPHLAEDLAKYSCFPITVKFTTENMEFGPQLGRINLHEVQTKEVVLATSDINGIKYAIAFPSDLPITINLICGQRQELLERDENESKVSREFQNYRKSQRIQTMLNADPRTGFRLSKVFDTKKSSEHYSKLSVENKELMLFPDGHNDASLEKGSTYSRRSSKSSKLPEHSSLSALSNSYLSKKAKLTKKTVSPNTLATSTPVLTPSPGILKIPTIIITEYDSGDEDSFSKHKLTHSIFPNTPITFNDNENADSHIDNRAVGFVPIKAGQSTTNGVIKEVSPKIVTLSTPVSADSYLDISDNNDATTSPTNKQNQECRTQFTIKHDQYPMRSSPQSTWNRFKNALKLAKKRKSRGQRQIPGQELNDPPNPNQDFQSNLKKDCKPLFLKNVRGDNSKQGASALPDSKEATGEREVNFSIEEAI